MDGGPDPAVEVDRHWQSVEPILDAAISRLSSEDQSTIVLKFFRGMTSGEIAASIGITEEAVRKRVSRALERLRGHLASAGAAPAACTAGELARLLASNAVTPAPAQLLAHAATVAASARKSVSLLHAILAMTTTTKSAMAIGMVVVVLLCGAGVVLVASDYFNSSSAPASAPNGPSSNETIASPNGLTLEVRATIDGSDVLNITPDGAAWTHLYWDVPSRITFNGKHTSPAAKTSLEQLGLNQADLSSATVVSRRGRGLVALDKTAAGIAIHFDDPDGGAGAYQILISFQPKSNAAAPTTLPAPVNPVTLDIKARICGAELLTITSQGAHWTHLTAGWPDSVSINGKAWNVHATPANNDPVFANLDLASAQVVERSGRDSVVMEKSAAGLAIYFSDTFGGLSDYHIKIRLSTLK
jgi:hypothetical protein